MSISVSYTDKHGRPVKPKTRVAVWKGKREMVPLGQHAKAVILDKTARGLDATGRPFAGYTADYAEETGEIRPDLTRTGLLLASLEVHADATTVEVSTGVPYAKAVNFGSRRRGIPRREFMAIDQPTVDVITKETGRRVVENVEVSFGARRAFARGRGLLP